VSIAIFNVKEEFIANVGQIVFVLVLIVIALTIFQFMLFVLLLFFLAFYLQLKHVIGRFSIVLTMVAFGLTTAAWVRITESQFYEMVFQRGAISLSKLELYLPKVRATTTMEWRLGSIYVVEEVASTLLIVLLFLAASKWLEKVVLR